MAIGEQFAPGRAIESVTGNRRRFRISTGWLLVLPAVIYLLAWSIYPLAFALYTSLTNRILTKPRTGDFIGIDNYRRLFEDDLLRVAVTNTLTLTVASIVLELFVGYWFAKLFFRTQHMPGAGALRTVFIIPIMLTPLLVGLSWSYILNPTLGIMTRIFDLLGLPDVQWFANPNLSLLTIIGINSWQWIPFMMLLTLAGLNNIPKDLQEFSTLEGAGWFQRLRNLEIPYITNVVVLGILIRVMDNLKLFDIIYATTGGGPGTSSEVLSLMAYRQSFLYYNTAYGATIGIGILVLSNILIVILFRTLLRGGIREVGA